MHISHNMTSHISGIQKHRLSLQFFGGVAEDCCMLSIHLVVPSCFNSFWHGVIPTSFFIFNDFYTCYNILYDVKLLAMENYILGLRLSLPHSEIIHATFNPNGFSCWQVKGHMLELCSQRRENNVHYYKLYGYQQVGSRAL